MPPSPTSPPSSPPTGGQPTPALKNRRLLIGGGTVVLAGLFIMYRRRKAGAAQPVSLTPGEVAGSGSAGGGPGGTGDMAPFYQPTTLYPQQNEPTSPPGYETYTAERNSSVYSAAPTADQLAVSYSQSSPGWGSAMLGGTSIPGGEGFAPAVSTVPAKPSSYSASDFGFAAAPAAAPSSSYMAARKPSNLPWGIGR